MWQNLRQRFGFFLEFGYFHGIRYLGQRCGYLGKCFWAIMLVVSTLGLTYILQLTLNSFREDVVVVNVNMAYLHWTNTFPAVSLCISKGTTVAPIQSFAEEYIKQTGIQRPPNFKKFIKIMQDYMFIGSTTIIRTYDYCETVNGSCGVDMEEFRRKILPMHCSQFMHNLTYLGRTYTNCEDIFKMRYTEMGICFLANNMHMYDMNSTKLPLKYDRSHFDRTLAFSYTDVESAHFTLFVHSPDQLPYFNMDTNMLNDKGIKYEIAYKPIEIDNGDDVRDASVRTRECRFPDERLPGSHFPYSFSTCMSDLMIRTELEQCNCTNPTSPIEYASRYCTYEGFQCLADGNVVDKARDLHNMEETKCIQSCIEMELDTIQFKGTILSNKSAMVQMNINILNMPTLRYKRKVAKTQLDLVVSVGGVVGLFTGASILSAIEFLYIWLMRRFSAAQ